MTDKDAKILGTTNPLFWKSKNKKSKKVEELPLIEVEDHIPELNFEGVYDPGCDDHTVFNYSLDIGEKTPKEAAQMMFRILKDINDIFENPTIEFIQIRGTCRQNLYEE